MSCNRHCIYGVSKIATTSSWTLRIRCNINFRIHGTCNMPLTLWLCCEVAAKFTRTLRLEVWYIISEGSLRYFNQHYDLPTSFSTLYRVMYKGNVGWYKNLFSSVTSSNTHQQLYKTYVCIGRLYPHELRILTLRGEKKSLCASHSIRGSLVLVIVDERGRRSSNITQNLSKPSSFKLPLTWFRWCSIHLFFSDSTSTSTCIMMLALFVFPTKTKYLLYRVCETYSDHHRHQCITLQRRLWRPLTRFNWPHQYWRGTTRLLLHGWCVLCYDFWLTLLTTTVPRWRICCGRIGSGTLNVDTEWSYISIRVCFLFYFGYFLNLISCSVR